MLTIGILSIPECRAEMCDQPPFGASAEEWEQAQPELQAIASALLLRDSPGIFGHGSKWYMENVVYKGLWKGCHARFSTNLEDGEFAHAHIDIQQQKTLPPTTPAIRFFHSEGYPINPTTDVYCEMNGLDGHPLWATGPECASAVVSRWQESQAQKREKQRQQQLAEGHPGIEYIYALFLCVRQTGRCEMQGAPRIALGELMPGMYFHTLAECQATALRNVSFRRPVDGRYLLSDDMWYECRRHQQTDPWEPAE